MAHILMFLEHDFPEDERVEKEALSLIKRGYKVSILCAVLGLKHEDKVTYKGIDIYKRPLSTLEYKSSIAALSFPLYINYWLKIAIKLAVKIKPDVIHVHDLPLAKVGSIIAQKVDAKWVLDLHENWPALLELSAHTKTFWGKILSKNKQWVEFEKKMVNKADGVLVVIEEAKDRLLEISQPKELNVVSNTISVPENQSIKYKESSEEINFIYAGGITYHRGLQFVIKGIKTLISIGENVKLTLVGAGRYQTELEELIQEYQIEKQVVFKGHLSYSKMMNEIEKADIALIPHLASPHTNATIPNKLFQYAYLKKPVLASNCMPIKRIVEGDKLGAIYQFDDSDDFVDKALMLIKDMELRKQMAENGHLAVMEKYNWEKQADVLEAFYHKILKK